MPCDVVSDCQQCMMTSHTRAGVKLMAKKNVWITIDGNSQPVSRGSVRLLCKITEDDLHALANGTSEVVAYQ